MVASVTRSQVLGFRVRAQQLDLEGLGLADAAILDIGVQDTGPDGAGWALANRGVDMSERSGDELVKVWTIRGAPHVSQRKHLPSVAAAVKPFSDADAGKRIYDAAKPLKTAGISNLAALDPVAAALRDVVTAGLWRPRKSEKNFRVHIELWAGAWLRTERRSPSRPSGSRRTGTWSCPAWTWMAEWNVTADDSAGTGTDGVGHEQAATLDRHVPGRLRRGPQAGR